MGGLWPGHHLSHDPRRHRRQQNSVPKMSGRHKISRRRRCAQNRQPVGRSRTQTCPCFQNPRVGQASEPAQSPPAATSGSSPAPSACRIPLLPRLPRSASAHRCAESGKRPVSVHVRTTWRTSSFSGMATHSICPLTGRVGNGCGPICPAQAPAQFTTMPAANCVLLVRTPHALPSATSTASTWSPEEKSTPRCRAAAMAAAVRCRGSTQRSFTGSRAVRCGTVPSGTRNAGSNSRSDARSRIRAGCVVAGLSPAGEGHCRVPARVRTSVPDRPQINLQPRLILKLTHELGIHPRRSPSPVPAARAGFGGESRPACHPRPRTPRAPVRLSPPPAPAAPACSVQSPAKGR